MALRIIPTIEKAGGAVLVRAPVSSLLVEKGRCCGVVVKRGGDEMVELRANAVISACGALNTFTKLMPDHALPLVAAPLRALAESDGLLERGCSHLMLFVALRGSREELGLPAANYWITPGHDHDAAAEAYYGDVSAESDTRVDFPAVFLSFPSAKDSTWAERHPGKSTAHIVAEVPWEVFADWDGSRIKRRGAEYEALKERLATALLQRMLHEFPQLADRIEFHNLGTPLTSAFYLGSHQGVSYGLSPTPERFRKSAITEPRTDLPGLYLTGQVTSARPVATK